MYLVIITSKPGFCPQKTFTGDVGKPIFALKRQVMKPEQSLACHKALVSSVETKLFESQVLDQFESRPQLAPALLYVLQT